MFWVFIFPVLLTAGLGIAFRNQAPTRHAGGRGRRDPATDSCAASPCRPATGSRSHRSTDSAAARGAPDRPGGPRGGAGPGRDRGVSLRQRSGRRAGRPTPGGRRGAARGRAQRPRDGFAIGWSSEPGARYVDFVVPGLLGMNLMGSGIWGLGLRDRGCAAEEAAQAADRDADVPDAVSRLVRPVPAHAARHRGWRSCSASRPWSSACRCAGSILVLGAVLCALGARLQRRWACSSPPGPRRSKACRG